jgi:hypothetical protein
MRYRAVIFDVGGVVVGSPLHAIAQYERDKNILAGAINRVIVETGHVGAWSRLERGELGLDMFYADFDRDCAAIGPAFSAREMMERIAACVVPRPQMIAAIRHPWTRSQGGRAHQQLDHGRAGRESVRDLFDVFVESVLGLRKRPTDLRDRLRTGRGAPARGRLLDDIGGI